MIYRFALTLTISLGATFAQTNTGHDARKEPGGSFVMSNPQKAIDYAWRTAGRLPYRA